MSTKIQKNKPLHKITLSAKQMAQNVLNQDFKHVPRNASFPLATYRDFVGHNSHLNRIILYKMRRAASALMIESEYIKFHNHFECPETGKLKKGHRKTKWLPPLQACGVSMGILKGSSGVDATNINPTVDIVKSTDDKIHYHKVASCAMIWRCPVCSLKILKGRENTIYALAKSHERAGKAMGFATFTLPHKRNDSLEQTFNNLIDAYRALQSGRYFKEFRSGCKRKGLETDGKILGQIKSVEITWKFKNGWHPHLHVLYFYDLGFSEQDKKCIKYFQKTILEKWCSMTGAKMIGQDAQICYGIKGAAEYLAKWDAVKELTAEQLKQGKGITPFGMLKKIALKDYTDKKQHYKLAGLYREYAVVTKGKHRISFGTNLKKAYPKVIQDETDSELCQKIDIKDVLVQIHLSTWKQITHKQLQPHVINAYLMKGINGLCQLLHYKNIKFELSEYSDSIDFDTGEILKIPQIK